MSVELIFVGIFSKFSLKLIFLKCWNNDSASAATESFFFPLRSFQYFFGLLYLRLLMLAILFCWNLVWDDFTMYLYDLLAVLSLYLFSKDFLSLYWNRAVWNCFLAFVHLRPNHDGGFDEAFDWSDILYVPKLFSALVIITLLKDTTIQSMSFWVMFLSRRKQDMFSLILSNAFKSILYKNSSFNVSSHNFTRLLSWLLLWLFTCSCSHGNCNLISNDTGQWASDKIWEKSLT